MHTSTRQSGFTLIELIIVVAIIGILSAVAYPIYTDQIRKGKRADARAALTNLLQQQERYLTQRNTYAAFPVGAASSTTPFKDYAGPTKAQSTHLLGAQECQVVGTTLPPIRDCVEVFAVPQANVDSEITLMAIDSQSRTRCTGSNTSRCWK